MIAQIRGKLTAVDGEAAYVQAGGLVYQVYVPLNIVESLHRRIEENRTEIELHTIHYIEGGIGSGSMVPRLIGFTSVEDRQFFHVFTTVRGLGFRKALRALCVPVGQIVKAIETGDRSALVKLPEIGARTADRIIAELKGKLKVFAFEDEPEPEPAADADMVEQALEILMLRLQFTRTEAEEQVKKVLAADNTITTVQDLIREVFQRQGQGAAR